MVITSFDNPVIKMVVSLKQKKYRKQLQKYTIEGIKLVEEALKSNAPVDYILTVNEKTDYGNIKTYTVTQKVFNRLSDLECPQGIMAVVNMQQYELDDIIKGENDIIVILDGLQDPGNIGTIVRTADAMGANGIIALKGTGDVYNSKAIRASMGSIFHIPMLYVEDPISTYEFLKKKDIKVVATALDGDLYPYDVSFANSAIIFGNEGSGISDISREMAEYILKIPMAGSAESLNVASSAAIVLYEALRQREKGGL